MDRRRRLPSSKWLAMSFTFRRELVVGCCHSSADNEHSYSTRQLVTSGKRSATRISGIAIGDWSPGSFPRQRLHELRGPLNPLPQLLVVLNALRLDGYPIADGLARDVER